MQRSVSRLIFPAILAFSCVANAQTGMIEGDWRYYGGDSGSA